MIELLTKFIKDVKVLVGASLLLNVALVAVILHGADDATVNVAGIEIKVKTLALDKRIEALFDQPEQRKNVVAMLQANHFFEIGADTSAESIASALMTLDRKHTLVAKLRDMSHRLEGPFKGLDTEAEIERSDVHTSTQGIAQVCRGSGFEDMYLVIFGTGQPQRSVTVHAEKQTDCSTKKRDVVQLHSDDWKNLFDDTDVEPRREVSVGLHPPRFTRVDSQQRHLSALKTPAN